VRAVTLGLVLRAAAKGEMHRRTTEATKAVVFSFVIENIKHTSTEMNNPRGVSEFDRAEAL
jgi:hypothetical protein